VANSLRDPISKITRAKRTGGVAQVIECLPCKHKALNSNPVQPKEKKIKKERKKERNEGGGNVKDFSGNEWRFFPAPSLFLLL
jgi:hypothetical protein